MHVPRCQPHILVLAVYSSVEITHLTFLIVHEPMARRQITIRGNAQISRSRATRVRPVSSTVNFLECVDDVREGVTLALNYAAFEFNTTLNHGIKKTTKVAAQ